LVIETGDGTYNGGVLDLNNNDLIVYPHSTAMLTTIRNDIINALKSTLVENDPKIKSSVAVPDKTGLGTTTIILGF
jgi:hypothetical protein